ncbi:hypothetical protein C5S31_00120 [ANME-1 cluster archaeon GoMg2]|nr:hypothetical protein [ANME-1 cluster archaeon GoMg2]
MKLIAHRGARAEEPENTLRALKKSFLCGTDDKRPQNRGDS